MQQRVPVPAETSAHPSLGATTVVDGVASSPLTMGASGTCDTKDTESTWTVPWLLADRIARTAERPIIERRTSLGTWTPITARAFGEEVARIAAGLIGLGLEAGASVALMSRTCYEWTLLDMAIARAGLVSVPIYETDSAEQIEWILDDAAIRLVLTETSAHALVVDAAIKARASADPETAAPQVLSLDRDALTELTTAGRAISRAVVDDRSAAVRPDDIYSIIYTSGTTGRPKGVEITHRNAAGLAHNGVHWIPDLLFRTDTRLLLFLPLAHSYARCLELLSLAGQGVLGHTPDVKTLLPDLQAFGPSYVLAVPRVLEKIYNAADAKAGSGVKLRTFRWAAKVAVEYSRALDTPVGPSRSLSAAHAAADRLVYRTIRSLLGPNARFAISGGGPLGERLGHFYRGMGLEILEGYGLTETIGPTCVNLDVRNKIGTVGPPVCGNDIRVDESGEILVRGLGVFRNRRGLHRRWLVPHRGHRRDRRRRLGAHHRPQEGPHRHRGRQERRPRDPRGPPARPPAGQPGPRPGGQRALHLRAHHAGRRDAAPVAAQPRPAGDGRRRGRVAPAGPRRAGARRRPHQRGGLPGRVDPRVPSAHHGLHGGQRAAYPLAQGQEGGRHGGPRRRRRLHLRRQAAGPGGLRLA